MRKNYKLYLHRITVLRIQAERFSVHVAGVPIFVVQNIPKYKWNINKNEAQEIR